MEWYAQQRAVYIEQQTYEQRKKKMYSNRRTTIILRLEEPVELDFYFRF